MNHSMPKKESMLATISILIILVFLLLSDGWSTYQQINFQFKRDAENGAIYAEELVSDVIKLLDAVSKAPVIRSNDYENISLYLYSINNNFPQVSAIALANTSGIRVAGSNLNIKTVDVSKTEFYKTIMKTKKPFVSGVIKSLVNNNLEFIVGYPLFDKNNDLQYILYAPIYLDSFKKELLEIKNYSGGNFLIVDKYNHVLVSSGTPVNKITTFNLNDSISLFGNKFYAEKQLSGVPWKVIIYKDMSEIVKLIAKKLVIDICVFIVILLPVILGFYSLLSQLNKQKQTLIESNIRLQNLASTDGLTSLLNHRAFQEKLAEKIAAASDEAPLTLLMMDLDNFKIFNDQYGHQLGDKALQHVSKLLTCFFNGKGVVARYGGEEFAVILPNTSKEQGLSYAQEYYDELCNHPFKIDDATLTLLTVSIGVATYPKDASDKENLIRFADQALYRAKEQQSNKVQMYYSVLEELRGKIHSDKELLETIYTLNTIINAKDKYTCAHSERVMEYAVELARAIGLNDEDINNITIGALLHDIGKIEITGDILNKPNKLSNEEFEHIKKHPSIGCDIMKPVKTLEKALPFVLYHHERYDGKGYPYGLSGKDIPLYARIAAIADSFDAMTTKRPYQKAKTTEEALAEIKKCAGTQFDPELVEKFIDLFQQKSNHQMDLHA